MSVSDRPVQGASPIRHDRPGDIVSMPSPRWIGHISILTGENFEKMIAFYCTLLGAEVINGVEGFLSFPSFDGEHHRLAIIKAQGLEKRPKNCLGMNHAAFSYSSLAEILFVYERMKGLDVRPLYCVNHGTTTSLYYLDPDENQAEIFVDNFDTSPEVVHYKHTEQFLPGFGEMSEGNFDPDKMLALFRSGTPDSELRNRTAVRRMVKEGKL
jgi:catechol-2,3-dioxygenase